MLRMDGMTTEYPVQVEVTSPPHFDRIQLLLRLVLAIVLGWVGITAGWLVCMLYGALPLITAIAISSFGRDQYESEIAPKVSRVLVWLLQLSAYMVLLVDRFPAGEDTQTRVAIRITGKPSVGSALYRLLTSLPSGLVLMLLWCVSGIVCFIAAWIVLFGEPIPHSMLGFQRGVLRWQARLVAYHASLVDEYPPFELDTSDHHELPLATTSGAH